MPSAATRTGSSKYSEDYLNNCKTTRDLAELFRVSMVTMGSWIVDRGMPVFKVGGKRFHYMPEIQRWIKEQNEKRNKR